MPSTAPPDPQGVRTIDDLTERLRQLQLWSGAGYHEIHRRILGLRQARGDTGSLSYNTVYRCLRPGRSRLDTELVADIVRVLVGDDAAVISWRLACQAISHRASAAGIVSVRVGLPDDLPGFTGRAHELGQIAQAASIVVIEGMPGVGKSALAVHAGHSLRGRYAGQWWVNLRGYDPAQPPAEPSAVLEAFLRLLGVPADQIYRRDLAQRTAAFRGLIAGRQMLIVLDNAAGEDQVRPLLAPVAGCLTLITSRRAMPGLSPSRRLRLSAFTALETTQFFRYATSAQQISAAPDLARRLADAAGHLPLALGLIASRINDSPEWTLADHLDRLTTRRKQRRLDDGVELALGLSYDALEPDLQRTWRLLSLNPGNDFCVYAAAALTGADIQSAQRHLDDLLAANLLQQPLPQRYQFHDVVGVYASARTTDAEPVVSQRAAFERLLDFYLATAATAMDVAFPAEKRRRPVIPPPDSPLPALENPAQARAWLDTEWPNIFPAIGSAAAANDWHVTQFAAVLWRWLGVTTRISDELIVFGYALDVAKARQDPVAEGAAHVNLSLTYSRFSQYPAATAHLELAAKISAASGDRLHEGRANGNLGIIDNHNGQFASAVKHFASAIAIYRELGDRSGEARASSNLAESLRGLGRYRHAIAKSRQALRISREAGDRIIEGVILGNLSENYAYAGRIRCARRYYRQALQLNRTTGHRVGEAAILGASHVTGLTRGFRDMVKRLRRAITIGHDIGDPELESRVRNNFGDALRLAGRFDAARHQHQAALALARESGNVVQRARARNALARLGLAAEA